MSICNLSLLSQLSICQRERKEEKYVNTTCQFVGIVNCQKNKNSKKKKFSKKNSQKKNSKKIYLR